MVFPHRIYSNIRRKYTDAIQNINKKRFSIYLKSENSCFRQRKRNLKTSFWKAWFVYTRADGRLQYRWLTQPKAIWNVFSFDDVIKEMVSVAAVQPSSYECS